MLLGVDLSADGFRLGAGADEDLELVLPLLAVPDGIRAGDAHRDAHFPGIRRNAVASHGLIVRIVPRASTEVGLLDPRLYPANTYEFPWSNFAA